ncbi:hypothetical protein SAMN04515647_1344 [Cohaesibacter sp. ES.047]|uniref:hypothetical protein n=1 Tax=Cohaesibacter sp. ES.047 TaxID=1798205 RepID=UPI000BB8149B|nr:hypothetical protein [Cohaesibacter sp. ES.047]SNY91134.1 hypothetical protein SAMN04515647_1344 [Cohaesibacter sp. ES.047]
MTGLELPTHESASASTAFFRRNRGISLILLAITGALALSIWSSDWAHDEVRDGFKLGFFPLLSLSIMGLSMFVMLFDQQAQQVTPEIADLRFIHVVLALATIAYFGLLFLSVDLLGFVPAFTVIVSGGALILGYKPLWAALFLGLVTASALRVLLMLLDVSVKDGPLSFLIGG